MIISNFILALRQRFQKNELERKLEPTQVMSNLKENIQYSQSGRDGSLAIVYELILHKIKKILPLNPTRELKALDLTCGSGQLIAKIAKDNPNVDFLGVDLSSQMLGLAEKTKKEYQINNINFKKLDINNIENEFEKKTFDFISWNLGIHHMNTKEDVIKIFNSIKKLLKDDGVFFFFDIERPKNMIFVKNFTKAYNSSEGKEFYECSYNSYLASFSFEEFEEIMKNSDFKEEYEHKDLILGNIFQYACTKKKNNKINRKPQLNHFWQKRDYYFLKTFFRKI